MVSLVGNEVVQVTGVVRGSLASKTEQATTAQIAGLAMSGAAGGILPLANGGTGNSPWLRALKCAASYRKNNLVINGTSTTNGSATSPGTAPSTTGMTNLLPSNGAALSLTAGATTAGSATITVASTTNVYPNMWVFENNASGGPLQANIATGSKVVSVLSPTQLLLSKPALATNTGLALRCASQNMKYIGGVPVSVGGNTILGGATNTAASPSYAIPPSAIEFDTDAANFNTATASIILQVYQGGGVNASYRVAIDGVYTAAATTTGSTGSAYIAITLATAGVHRVRIEWAINSTYAAYMIALYLVNNAKIWYPRDLIYKPRYCGFGDSYSAYGGQGFGHDQIIPTFCNLLGWDFGLCAQGGTGYVSPGGTNFAWTSPYRATDTTFDAYDIIGFYGSVNDNGQTAGAIQAAALQTWQNVRTKNPTTPFLIFGVNQTNTVSLATAQTMEGALQAAFTQWGDSNAVFIPVSTDPTTNAWIDATNVTTYIMGASDNTHPTSTGLNLGGQAFLAAEMANRASNALSQVVLI